MTGLTILAFNPQSSNAKARSRRVSKNDRLLFSCSTCHSTCYANSKSVAGFNILTQGMIFDLKPKTCKHCTDSWIASAVQIKTTDVEFLDTHYKFQNFIIPTPGSVKDEPTDRNDGHCSEVVTVADIHTFACSICDDVFVDKRSHMKHMEEHDESQRRKSNNLAVKDENKTFTRKRTRHDTSTPKTIEKSSSTFYQVFGSTSQNYKQDFNGKSVSLADPPMPLLNDPESSGDAALKMSQSKRPCLKPAKNVQVKHDGQSYFDCKICKDVFASLNELDDHVKNVHTITKGFDCKICEKDGFASLKDVDDHVKNVHAKIDEVEDPPDLMIIHPVGTEPRYECKKCGKRFKRHGHLREHTFTHINSKPFKCPKCEQCFKQKSYLRKHAIKCRIRHTFLCTQCPKKFCKEETLEKHIAQQHTQAKLFPCSMCDKSFMKQSVLERHEKTCHVTKNFQCDMCDVTFRRRAYLEHHEKQVHNVVKVETTTVKKFKCEPCGKAFLSEAKLEKHTSKADCNPEPCVKCDKILFGKQAFEKHMKRHQDLTCEVCKYEAANSQALKLHSVKHKDSSDFTCELCGQGFDLAFQLKAHRTIKHGDGKLLPCDQCDKKFPTRHGLARHALIHTGELTCKLCGKVYTRREDLKYHANVHLGLLPYKCDVCGKSYHSPYSLRKHKVLHSDNKPFLCQHCGRGFVNRDYLQCHIDSAHTKVKAHSCNVCGHSFSRLSHLNSHKTIHTNERRVKCGKCGKTLANKFSLSKHKCAKVYTPTEWDKGMPYQCEMCGRGFTKRHSLRYHMASHMDGPVCIHCKVRFDNKKKLQRHHCSVWEATKRAHVDEGECATKTEGQYVTKTEGGSVPTTTTILYENKFLEVEEGATFSLEELANLPTIQNECVVQIPVVGEESAVSLASERDACIMQVPVVSEDGADEPLAIPDEESAEETLTIPSGVGVEYSLAQPNEEGAEVPLEDMEVIISSVEADQAIKELDLEGHADGQMYQIVVIQGDNIEYGQ